MLNLEVHANVLKYCLAKRKPNVNIIIIYVNYNNYGLYGFSHKGFGQMSQLSEPLDSGWIRPKHFDDHSWNGCAHTHTHTPTHTHDNDFGWGNGVRTIYNHYQVSVPFVYLVSDNFHSKTVIFRIYEGADKGPCQSYTSYNQLLLVFITRKLP